MSQKWTMRSALALAFALACWLGWEQVRPRERVGDVPYVPTRMAVVDRMLELAGVGPDDFVFDLGSGDGRIVIRAARRFGARGRGVELDRLLLRESRAAAVAAGVSERVEFIDGDLFDADLADATAVTLFLLPSVNLRLRPHLLRQLEPGTPVVSNMWDMAEWQPDRHEVLSLEPPAEIYQWVVPAPFGGGWDLRFGDPIGDPARAGDEPTLRLLQRFQELDGELRIAGRVVPVTGIVDGTHAALEATRADVVLGQVSLSARLDGDTLVGTLHVGDGSIVRRLTARRRPAAIEGVWRVGAAREPFVPQWTMRWRRVEDRWTATRRSADTGAAAIDTPLPGMSPPSRSAAAPEQPMTDIYVWGSSIAFVIAAGDGTSRRVSYYGLVEDDRIRGVAHDRGNLVSWTAVRAQATR
jgi:hypothetical protein